MEAVVCEGAGEAGMAGDGSPCSLVVAGAATGTFSMIGDTIGDDSPCGRVEASGVGVVISRRGAETRRVEDGIVGLWNCGIMGL